MPDEYNFKGNSSKGRERICILTIQPVHKRNNEDILRLRAAKGQEGFVESPADCLKEAQSLSLWRPVGIYEENRAVGFAMYGFFPQEGKHGRAWLDRLLIDEQSQGRGLGREALSLLADRIFMEYQCTCIYLSVYPENLRAKALYEQFGFQCNGETDVNGEQVMVLYHE